MRRSREARIVFVRALLGGADAVRDGAVYATGSAVKLATEEVRHLLASGAIAGDAVRCRANAETRNWLKRQMLESEPFQAQHVQVARREGLSLNITESPVARLAVARGPEGVPYLAPHHVEAAERFRRLFERAALQPKVTMDYSLAAATGAGGGTGDISDMASDARKELARIHAALPADCVSIAVDVCGLLKGVQQVEVEHGWPRRSGKLVLRIALEALANHFGLGAHAVGAPSKRAQIWREDGARPTRFE